MIPTRAGDSLTTENGYRTAAGGQIRVGNIWKAIDRSGPWNKDGDGVRILFCVDDRVRRRALKRAWRGYGCVASRPRGEWRIPMTKNGTPQTVPLVAGAVDILKSRKQLAECADSAYVFPGAGKSGHLVEPKKARKIILDKAGIKDLRLHDLRRTMGLWQAGTGANLSVIGRSLNHKSTTTTAIYARLWMEPVRSSMETAATAMLEAANSSADSAAET